MKSILRINCCAMAVLCKKMLKRGLRFILNTKLSVVFCLILFLVAILVISSNSRENHEVVKLDLKYPLIMWMSKNFPGTNMTRTCLGGIQCEVRSNIEHKKYNVDAYLFYGSEIDFNDLPLPRRQQDIWGLFHEESPRNIEEFMHESMIKLFNFTSTFSRQSDVPFPLQYLRNIEDVTSTKYFKTTSEKNNFSDISDILYLQSDCETATERDAYVAELMKHIKVDSYGQCLNNKELPSKFKEDYLNNLDEDDFLHFVSRYKFVIAIENGVCNDYITEKFWRPIKVGAVPIYFGSPSIRDWLPNNKSAILLQDYPTVQDMKDHLLKLLNSDSLYEEHLEHKTKQIITNKNLLGYSSLLKDGLDTVKEFECFVCEKIYERNEGFTEVHVANKNHYDCPKPLSALTLSVNPTNSWVYSWQTAKWNAEKIYQRVISRM